MSKADGVQRFEQLPLPLGAAVRHLSRCLRDGGHHRKAACMPDGWRILRLEVPLAIAGPQVKALLDWLTHQRLFPRALFAARDGSLLVAGAGAAHVHRTGGTGAEGTMMMRISHFMVLFSMPVALEPEATTCSSLVQREQSMRSRTVRTHSFLLQSKQMLSSWMSSAALALLGQKPQSKGSGIMFLISVILTGVLLVGGCILLARVHKSWQQGLAGREAEAKSTFIQATPKSWSGSARAVPRAPKPEASDASSGAARAREELPVMCDDLVVPDGRECVLFFPKFERHEISINDHKGQTDNVRLILKSPSHEVFATIRNARASGMAALAIHGPTDREFGCLGKQDGDSRFLKNGDYEFLGSGRCIRFQSSSGRLNVVDEDTRLMALCESEKGTRQIRIGPRVDVGLVIAAILGTELLEKDFK
eukprot:g14960.t1